MIKNALIGIAFVAGITGFVISMYNQNTKLVFIDMGKVYKEFSLSKELNGQLEKVFKQRKIIVDSLFENLRRQTQEVKFKEKQDESDIKRLTKLEEEFLYKKEQFEKENQATSSQYETKIWNQINQYVKDFGNKGQYSFILGANGQGSIMFADESRNVTEEVISYINNRYNGLIPK